MRLFLILLLSILGFSLASASQIVDVRRNITLSDEDKVYKDFYIAGGSEKGFKTGQTLIVSRKVSVRDASGSTAVGEMMIPVGELKVIAVYEKVTVAREAKLLDRKDLPMLEQPAIMTGDLVSPK